MPHYIHCFVTGWLYAAEKDRKREKEKRIEENRDKTKGKQTHLNNWAER